MIFDAGVLPAQQFRECENLYLELEELPGSSPRIQEEAPELLNRFNSLWEFFRRGGFFSSNEDLDEYSTTKIRFFMIPYYIGRLHLMFNDAQSRPAHIETAISYLRAFSDQMTHFHLIDDEKPVPKNPTDRRTYMMAEFKEKRELEERVKALNRHPQRDDLERGYIGDSIDEETERDLIMDLLKLSTLDARSQVRSSTDELPFAQMRAQGVKPQEPTTPPPKMWVQKIDRESMRKQVFAPLESFMPQPLPPDDETWAQPGKPKARLDASDDEEAEIARKEAAKWDDYKDSHPPFSQMGDEGK
ncbi:hypothetical protein TRFO_10615 [Tritrichomonas foetus]|uniref:TAP42-like family protein n=1 Tax=Tritrichomonas foetus TaxID=1144522 RepID=A0A1J4J7E3_9EUKA|nr:hypothetical protein TRFO_10615 [Tritrichomonas foetus]|eukprot:OHS95146.1 hypothetical protein TRFO_10615 [Tritrichomonas foetus]